MRLTLLLSTLLFALPTTTRAATLPTHDPVRILVVSDRVNPHGLSPDELTEPGDIKAALDDPASDLNLAEPVMEVDSQCIDAALTALGSATPPDVVVYFAHKAAQGCDGSDQQPALTAAIETHLQSGGGVAVFHHGMFAADGKGPLLQLLGGEATGIEWNTAEGQDVVCLAAAHFVTANGMSWPSTVDFELSKYGISSGTYEQFVNVPDERYTTFVEHAEAGEVRRYLFGSTLGTGPRILSYQLQRDGWQGHVIAYQPGEHQPTALGDKEGNNFQILVNAIFWSWRAPQVSSPNPPSAEPAPDSAGDPKPPGDTDDGCSAAPTHASWLLVLLLVKGLLVVCRRGRRWARRFRPTSQE